MNAAVVLRLVAPEFAAVSDEDVASWLELCEPLVNRKKFGKLYNQALALLAAHRMKLCGKYEPEATSGILEVANSGRVASYTEGQTSISFNTSSAGGASSDAFYELTSYGQQFLELRRAVIVPITIRGGGFRG